MAEYEGRVHGSVLREYDSLVAWDFRAVDAEWAVVEAGGAVAREDARDEERARREPADTVAAVLGEVPAAGEGKGKKGALSLCSVI
jgi:hypothetical protein